MSCSTFLGGGGDVIGSHRGISVNLLLVQPFDHNKILQANYFIVIHCCLSCFC